jgi:hypothetical protein
MMVALFHLTVIGHIYPGSMDALTLVNNSWLFVDFFFVLSGFIITHSLSRGLDSPRALTAFAIRRFGRLWPTHLAIIVLMLTYQFIKVSPDVTRVSFDFKTYSLHDFILSLFYYLTFIHSLPNFYQIGIDNFVDINPPSWSISVEYWTYLIFGLILLYGQRWRVPVMLAAIVGSSVTLFVVMGEIGATFGYGLLRCVYGFFVGHFVYQFYRASAFDPRRWRWAVTGLEALAVVASATFVAMVGSAAASLLAPVVFGATVYVFAFEAGWVSRLMMTRPVQWLGTLSFTIYMGHALVARTLADGIRLVEGWLGVDYSLQRVMYGETVTLVSFPSTIVANLTALGYVLLVIGFAAAMSRWVEVPWRDRVNRFAKLYGARPPAQSAAALTGTGAG